MQAGVSLSQDSRPDANKSTAEGPMGLPDFRASVYVLRALLSAAYYGVSCASFCSSALMISMECYINLL
jgi:hypothetical protein